MKECRRSGNEANMESVNRIIYNDSAHLVAVFKDYLIYEDVKELLQVYNIVQSRYLLAKLTKETPRNIVLSTYSISKTKAFKQATKRRNKILRIKAEDRESREEESTLFRTEFINSLAKEDLSNSISALPANSLECSQSEDIKKIGELLAEFNNCDQSNTEEEKLTREYGKQIPLNRRVAEGLIDRKHLLTADYRNAKILSSNACYETAAKGRALMIKSLDKLLAGRANKQRNRTLTRLLTDADNEGVLSSPETESCKKNCFNIYKFKLKGNIFGREDNARSNIFTYPLNKRKKFNMFSGRVVEKNRIVLSMSTRFKDRPKVAFRKEEQASPKIIRNTPVPKKRIIISPKLKFN
eukprot:TRINITY_DN4278_c0_g4_i2.p1 TRINITY_DN4278_c0_g4~~TRINITY_DN4278_c0_g4_i2.p1  ORF type:complete len:354 (-),score=109.31 TRINITY_DN4278_c0_g4_i2:602-1663(-)